ncbi:hypothetical protein [Pseudobutyrivibrio ruminis]|uniref:hypothetical protein n=1 Tax=Pseudobutyrivibrio ruminis TaxID=46206 RepID=UPI0004299D50|nr:hypothetical protein [Pseudobutyrivibrio ruminis]
MRKGLFNKKNLFIFLVVFVVVVSVTGIVTVDKYQYEYIYDKLFPKEEESPIYEEEVPLAGEQVYKYCPTCIDGAVFYCSNEATPGKVMDGICCNGQRVLATTKGDWDSVQVCDPSIISGDFSFNGSAYTYLMAYLGCATYDCTANEIGFAVSNDLVNWVKTGRVIWATRDGFWGVGQPSLLNYNGNIFLFYTSGSASQTTTYVEQLDCSDLNNVVHLGKKQITCRYDFISNADFAYLDGMIYMTCDTHPFPDGPLNFISAVQSVYSAVWDGSLESMDRLNWQMIARVGAETTGHERNHNGCFARDGSGRLLYRILFVSTADPIGSWSDNLYTYRFTTVGF